MDSGRGIGARTVEAGATEEGAGKAEAAGGATRVGVVGKETRVGAAGEETWAAGATGRIKGTHRRWQWPCRYAKG